MIQAEYMEIKNDKILGLVIHVYPGLESNHGTTYVNF